MRVLWLSWKGIDHPEAGGAEIVGHELRKRMVADGHAVTLLTSRHQGSTATGKTDGYDVVRVGGRFGVYWRAYRHYQKEWRGKYDLVIDECNTVPFFARFYAGTRVVMFVHQLAREIWFYQMPFPVSLIGYLLEPLYLRLLSGAKVITVSESTKRDLMRYGFKEASITIISEGVTIDPVLTLDMPKASHPTILSLGAVRPMKRTLDIVRGFEILKQSIPDAKLIIAGDMSGEYGRVVSEAVASSVYASDITVRGQVTTDEKIALLRTAHVLVVTSVKEGWGLVVTEANSQGTPAVVYNVDGLRDSVKDGVTGRITRENTPEGLSSAIVELLLNGGEYERMRRTAWEWSKEITFERCYKELKQNI
jgi:glycosyltransferase involved in cell wall biosynthesis